MAKDLRSSEKLASRVGGFFESVVLPSSQCLVKFVDFVNSSRCFTGGSSLSSWFALWGSYCLVAYKDC